MLTDEERTTIVRYRIERALDTLNEVDYLVQMHFYNNAANRLYYSCYYAASALLIANQVSTKSHDGVRQMFSSKFVKTGVFPSYFGRIYSELFSARQTGDYEDLFNHSSVTVSMLIPKATEFVDSVKKEVEMWLINH